METVASEFSGVVVAEIVEVGSHPDAKKLSVCKVDSGDSVLQIVCGAPNAVVGLKVPLAKVGAMLPDSFEIKQAQLRGIDSHGMLCAREELGVEGDSEGLWELPGDAPVGADIREYLQLDDKIIEVDLTPNRGDCLSIRGVARDVGVIYRADVKAPVIESVPASISDTVEIRLEAPQACSLYVGRVIRDVDVSAKSPLWLQQKLERFDIRPIDPIVDVTNYVLAELGQPMHAFDLDEIQGAVHARMARPGEKLKLLNEQEETLAEDILVIADDEKALAMAGIMGGAESAVSETTQNILLESAFFEPLAISGKGRRYGLHTESSHRFERGVDPELQREAIERATALLIDIAGGDAGPVVEQRHNLLEPEKSITLSLEKLEALIGCKFEAEEVTDTLQRLGMVITHHGDSSWTVTPPSWRFDMEIEEDLVEEIIRIKGYETIPERPVSGDFSMPLKPESELAVARLRQRLIDRDYHEIISYSFVDKEIQSLFSTAMEPVAVMNPISSDMSVMRLSLRPGLIGSLKHNLNRQHGRVRLFESGQCFIPNTRRELDQKPMLSGLIYGDSTDEQWSQISSKVDFYDIKADVESILELSGIEQYRFEPAEVEGYHPGQCAQIVKGGVNIGVVGALHPALQQKLDLPDAPHLFELRLEEICTSSVPAFSELSKYPSTRRDIALLVDRELPVQAMTDSARSVAGEQLHDIRIFDIYQGQGIENTKKSVAMGLTFMDSSRTLVDSEISAAMDAVIEELSSKYNAQLRN